MTDSVNPLEEFKRTTVIISKKWNYPAIVVEVTTEDLKLSLPLDKYMESVLRELKHPITLLTRKQLVNAVRDAMRAVEIEMKEMSKHGV